LGAPKRKQSKRQVALCCWPEMEMCKRHVVLGVPTASTQCYFGSCPARPKATLGPFLTVPKPKRHLALGLQRKGSMPSAMWRLGCLPS